MENGGLAIIDLIVTAGLIIFFALGFKHGLVEEFGRVLSTVIALVAATKLMPVFANAINNTIDHPMSSAIIAFTTVFIVAIYAVRYLVKQVSKVLKFSVVLGSSDKVFGGVFGVLKGAIIISLCLNLISLLPLSDNVKYQLNNAALYNPMRNIAPLAYSSLKAMTKDDFASEFEKTFSGIHRDIRGDAVNDFLEFHKHDKQQ